MRGMRFAVAGFLAVGMVVIAQAQPGRFGGGFGGGNVTGLVTNKAVQEDIKATEEQTTKLKDWSKDFGKKSFEMYKDAGIDFKSLGKADEETRAKLAEVGAKINKEAYKELGDVLKADQIKRLKQIQTQAMGVNAFTNADVVSALKLTDSQKSSVKGITGDFQKESKEIRDDANKGKKGGGFFLDPETQKKIQKVQKEYVGKVVDTLDDTQKKTWKDLTGEPFDLTKLQGQNPFGKKDAKKD